LGFDNAERIFPAVHPDTPFVLVTLGKAAARSRIIHYALRIEHLRDNRRQFALSTDEFALINPNTRTCPVFRSEHDAEMTKRLYHAAPVLVLDSITDEAGHVVQIGANPWGITFSQGLFNMTSDSVLFSDIPETKGHLSSLPLYESKMVHHYDHRWATHIAAPDKPNGLDIVDVNDIQKADPNFNAQPRYWVDQREVLARIARVPARVSGAWLACTKVPAGDYAAQIEADTRLRLALAGWVASELYLRKSDQLRAHGNPDDKVDVRAALHAETELRVRFPAYAQALLSIGLNSKKLPAELAKWAKKDAEARLGDEELEALTAHAITHIDTEVDAALMTLLDGWMDARSPRWLMGWRDITNATNERTVIAAVIARAGVGNNLPLMLFPSTATSAALAALLANLTALVFDFVARHKVGGTHLNYFIYKQLPVLPPNRYTVADLDYIVPRVLELTYTAHDLAPWAADLGYSGPPFAWNPERRSQLRAELDAYYARLYGLTPDELRYILDPADIMGPDYPSETFRVLKNNEMRQFGEYRTQRLVLAAWDALASQSHPAH
jgi:hypothetical protein